MPKLILLPVTGTDADAPVLAAALTAARLFDAHLVALHVRPDVQHDIAALAAADSGLTAGLDAALTRMEAEADQREQQAEANWRGFIAQHRITLAEAPRSAGVTSEFRAQIGNEADWLAEYGRTADLIVVGRPRPTSVTGMEVAEAALMDTGKPVLLATDPPHPGLNGVIGIAWKDTREAARAVSDALPFIRRAASVVVFTVAERDAQADPSVARLLTALRWHAPKVEVQPLRLDRASAPDTLLAGVSKAKCDLLVMGGYGHTRLREAVFGGFTRAMLERAPLPVLMSH